MDNVMVSVVVPIFSSGILLKETIESILAQTFRDFEIILVDNNASETTRSVALEYADAYPQLIRIIHEPVQGLPFARNTGIMAARGKYIALLDDDDMMAPDRLMKQHAIAKTNPDASLVFCGRHHIDKKTGKTVEFNVIGPQSRWEGLQMFVREILSVKLPDRNYHLFYFTMPSTMFFEKAKAVNAGLFDIRLSPYVGEDDVFCMNMFREGDFILLPEPLTLYRTGGGSDDTRKKAERLYLMLSHSHKVFYVLWEKFGGENGRIKKIFKKTAAYQLQGAAKHVLRYQGGTDLGRLLLCRAWIYSPLDPNHFKDFIKSLFPCRYHPRIFWFGQFRPETLPAEIDKSFVKGLFSVPPQWIKDRK